MINGPEGVFPVSATVGRIIWVLSVHLKPPHMLRRFELVVELPVKVAVAPDKLIGDLVGGDVSPGPQLSP